MIVEDHKKIRDELQILLTHNGYDCSAPESFEDIIAQILSAKAHLILLDINLPVYDGYYICREVRKQSDIPIIVITSRDNETDELIAMNIGADDYVTKPFHTQILLARIAAVLKRAYPETLPDRLDCGDFAINLSKSTLEYKGNSFELTKNEVKILTCLFDQKGAIVSRDALAGYLWDSDLFVDDNTLTVNMGRLRKKLEEAGLAHVIETRRGQGYLMV